MMGQYSPTKCSCMLALALMLLVVTDKNMVEEAAAAAAKVCEYKLKGEFESDESCDFEKCRDYCKGRGFYSGICAGNGCFCLSDCPGD